MGSCERRGLVRHPGVLSPTNAPGLAGVSLHAAGPEAVREGVGGGDAQVGRGRGERTGLMLKYGIMRSTMGEENSWLGLPIKADSASRSGRSWSLLHCVASCSLSP